jgi:phosphatidylinositol dimannoside acyltransferase
MAAWRQSFAFRALVDAVCLYAVPIGVAVLPWRVGFALLRRLAHWPALHRQSIDSLWASAAPFCRGADAGQWRYRARLLLLVEHADTYLTLLRGERWWRHNVSIRGALPSGDRSNLFLTYHWGSGNWIWRVLRAHGIGAYFLARRPSGRALGRTRLSHWYGALRAWMLRRNGSAGVIFTGDSAGTIRAALNGGRSLTGMLDVGASAGQQTASGTLLGHGVCIPSGLARIAVETKTPVTLFSVGLDYATGRRDLVVECLPADATLDQIMAAYLAHLDARLGAAPEAWQMWHEAHAIFASSRTDFVSQPDPGLTAQDKDGFPLSRE